MAMKLAEPILVTGATGMVGANLVHDLVRTGHRPFALVRKGSSDLRLAPVADRIERVTGDLCDAETMRAITRQVGPRTVFHLATSLFNPPTLTAAQHFEINTIGALNLFDALRDHAGCRVVITNSAAIYGGGRRIPETARIEPGTVYGAAKAAAGLIAQTYAKLHRLHLVELRLFTVYGPWERRARLIPSTVLSALTGSDLQMSAGTQERDFVHIDDAIDALVRAAVIDVPSGSAFNVSSGTGTKVVDMVRQILALMGNPIELRTGSLPMRPDEIMEISGDNTAAARGLGWHPRVSLNNGLDRAIDWYRSNRDLVLQLS